MKRLAILILSVLLLIPTGALACWDDDWDDFDDTDSWYDDSWYDDDWSYDDDWYNDDSWLDDDDNYDGGWLDDVIVTPDDDDWDGDVIYGDFDDDTIWLPDLVVTPDDNDDYDWGLDEDWWRTPDSDDDDDSNNDDDYQDWGTENDDGNGSSKDPDETNNTDSETNKKSPSQITDMAKSTVADMISKYGKNMAVCNFGVNTMFKSLFGTNDLDGKRANDMVKYWQNNPSHWEQISVSEAQQLANEGYFVVAGWINPSGGSGHVVVVVPGEETYSPKWGCDVPQTMDTGGNKRTPSQPISDGFGPDKKDNVKFFKYK